MLTQLGYGRRVYSKGLPLAENLEYKDELNDSVLHGVALAWKKFDWIKGKIKAFCLLPSAFPDKIIPHLCNAKKI
ncbi:MAG: hypothetical protein RM338_23560 [Nostoc sp. DedQUE12a]|nr:hypothetical protein [Nostoc sp. DedQUE12a]